MEIFLVTFFLIGFCVNCIVVGNCGLWGTDSSVLAESLQDSPEVPAVSIRTGGGGRLTGPAGEARDAGPSGTPVRSSPCLGIRCVESRAAESCASSKTPQGIMTLSTLMPFASNSVSSGTSLTAWARSLSRFSSVFLPNVLCLLLSLCLLPQRVAGLGSSSLP